MSAAYHPTTKKRPLNWYRATEFAPCQLIPRPTRSQTCASALDDGTALPHSNARAKLSTHFTAVLHQTREMRFTLSVGR